MYIIVKQTRHTCGYKEYAIRSKQGYWEPLRDNKLVPQKAFSIISGMETVYMPEPERFESLYKAESFIRVEKLPYRMLDFKVREDRIYSVDEAKFYDWLERGKIGSFPGYVFCN